jgi:ABC-type glycerol-3-phosphate transport system substrate-binding protein
MGAYWGDFNNDGKADLFLTQYGTNRLYQNNGEDTFSDVSGKAGITPDGHWHLSAAVADVDHDGDLDIYVGNYIDPKQLPKPTPPGSRGRTLAKQLAVVAICIGITVMERSLTLRMQPA